MQKVFWVKVNYFAIRIKIKSHTMTLLCIDDRNQPAGMPSDYYEQYIKAQIR
jgi:hypothetical protein